MEFAAAKPSPRPLIRSTRRSTNPRAISGTGVRRSRGWRRSRRRSRRARPARRRPSSGSIGRRSLCRRVTRPGRRTIRCPFRTTKSISKTRTGAEPSGDPFQICSVSRVSDIVAYAILVPSGDHSRFGAPELSSRCDAFGEPAAVGSVGVHDVQRGSPSVRDDRDARAVGRPRDPGSFFARRSPARATPRSRHAHRRRRSPCRPSPPANCSGPRLAPWRTRSGSRRVTTRAR